MTCPELDGLRDSLKQLLETYNELNSTHIDELFEEPSALEFSRHVAQNRPFVIRGGCSSWKAVQQWDASYLTHMVGDSEVNVAITPFGNADSVVSLPDETLSFVKPLERLERFRDVLAFIQAQELQNGPEVPIKYAQTQNDNLRGEYAELFRDVPKDMPFARIALQKDPDAVNFWLGNSRSVTALHKDNYENVYAQVRGRKHFVLLPPIAAPCVNEQALPGATYGIASGTLSASGESEERVELEVRLDEPRENVPVSTWDPDKPDERATPYSHLAMPMRVTLNEGDLLYLPAMWFHKVSQSCGDEGYCCAVNYWYDMEFSGAFWTTNAFIRDVGNALARHTAPNPSSEYSS